MRTQSLRIIVSTPPFQEEDLRDFEQYLSYCDRDTPEELRIYNFPDDQHETDATMDLQIVLDRLSNRLELIRARRSSPLFTKSDE